MHKQLEKSHSRRADAMRRLEQPWKHSAVADVIEMVIHDRAQVRIMRPLRSAKRNVF